MKREFLIFIVIIFLTGCASSTKKSPQIVKKNSTIMNLNEGLESLTKDIIFSLTKNKKRKIAVIPFSNLNNRVTPFGKYVSEELTTRLFKTDKFQVIERNLLGKIMKEHKLNDSGLIDENSAKEIGKILGVDAITSGTVSDLGENIKINARIISTQTGSLLSVASAKILKDREVFYLMKKNRLKNPKVQKQKPKKVTNIVVKPTNNNKNRVIRRIKKILKREKNPSLKRKRRVPPFKRVKRRVRIY